MLDLLGAFMNALMIEVASCRTKSVTIIMNRLTFIKVTKKRRLHMILAFKAFLMFNGIGF